VNVPTNAILLGCKGSSSSRDIMTLAEESVAQDILGIMVWYVSVVDGLHYQVNKNFLKRCFGIGVLQWCHVNKNAIKPKIGNPLAIFYCKP
jgi:hypothetical protein